MVSMRHPETLSPTPLRVYATFNKACNRAFVKSTRFFEGVVTTMRRFSLFAFIGAWVFAVPTYAQFAPGSVEEDGDYNTAVGSGALSSQQVDENNSECPSPSCGAGVMAVGASALASKQSGAVNTATVFNALFSN